VSDRDALPQRGRPNGRAPCRSLADGAISFCASVARDAGAVSPNNADVVRPLEAEGERGR